MQETLAYQTDVAAILIGMYVSINNASPSSPVSSKECPPIVRPIRMHEMKGAH